MLKTTIITILLLLHISSSIADTHKTINVEGSLPLGMVNPTDGWSKHISPENLIAINTTKINIYNAINNKKEIELTSDMATKHGQDSLIKLKDIRKELCGTDYDNKNCIDSLSAVYYFTKNKYICEERIYHHVGIVITTSIFISDNQATKLAHIDTELNFDGDKFSYSLKKSIKRCSQGISAQN